MSDEPMEELPGVPAKSRIVKYTDVLSQSELEELIKPVDDSDSDGDDGDGDDEGISSSQHERNCKEWEKLSAYIKIPHHYIELIMESNGVELPANSQKLEFSIRSIPPETVPIMNEALVCEAAFRQGTKHSTEWTLETDVQQLEAELKKARVTPLTDHLSRLTKSGRYPRLGGNHDSQSKTLLSPQVPAKESQKSLRQRRIKEACKKEALRQWQQLQSMQK
ncbi:uncharacterized protein LOC111070413 [Drosophila obscura]|uniref:uncharacterized protein LOC111070413 n=1 Tax=Drosophila obscura TaxID=7282 RepID=UPI001BB10237|nr:uncharacterized protein LOC111070413 [Drosophila obscura]